jgi:hypothetical protein
VNAATAVLGPAVENDNPGVKISLEIDHPGPDIQAYMGTTASAWDPAATMLSPMNNGTAASKLEIVAQTGRRSRLAVPSDTNAGGARKGRRRLWFQQPSRPPAAPKNGTAPSPITRDDKNRRTSNHGGR